MINQQLLDYIKQQQAAGKSSEQIKTELVGNGWKEPDINEGFAALHSGIMPVPPGELASAPTIFSEAWAFYNRHFWTLLGTAAVPIAILSVLSLFAGAGYLTGLFQHMSGVTFIIFVIILIVAAILAIYASLWGQVALLFAVKDGDQNITVSDAYKRSRPYITQYFSTALVLGLLAILGFILFVIPGVLVFVWYGFAVYAVITENLKTGAALKYSKSLVTGRFGAVLWRLFFGAILAVIVSLLVQGGMSLLGLGNYSKVVANLLSIIWTPLFTAYSFLLYRQLQGSR